VAEEEVEAEVLEVVLAVQVSEVEEAEVQVVEEAA
tara:strand:+ start:300 stop:404 length:105 start_codon:yes stop_codon:yes gene_type:complete